MVSSGPHQNNVVSNIQDLVRRAFSNATSSQSNPPSSFSTSADYKLIPGLVDVSSEKLALEKLSFDARVIERKIVVALAAAEQKSSGTAFLRSFSEAPLTMEIISRVANRPEGPHKLAGIGLSADKTSSSLTKELTAELTKILAVNNLSLDDNLKRDISAWAQSQVDARNKIFSGSWKAIVKDDSQWPAPPGFNDKVVDALSAKSGGELGLLSAGKDSDAKKNSDWWDEEPSETLSVQFESDLALLKKVRESELYTVLSRIRSLPEGRPLNECLAQLLKSNPVLFRHLRNNTLKPSRELGVELGGEGIEPNRAFFRLNGNKSWSIEVSPKQALYFWSNYLKLPIDSVYIHVPAQDEVALSGVMNNLVGLAHSPISQLIRGFSIDVSSLHPEVAEIPFNSWVTYLKELDNSPWFAPRPNQDVSFRLNSCSQITVSALLRDLQMEGHSIIPDKWRMLNPTARFDIKNGRSDLIFKVQKQVGRNLT